MLVKLYNCGRSTENEFCPPLKTLVSRVSYNTCTVTEQEGTHLLFCVKSVKLLLSVINALPVQVRGLIKCAVLLFLNDRVTTKLSIIINHMKTLRWPFGRNRPLPGIPRRVIFGCTSSMHIKPYNNQILSVRKKVTPRIRLEDLPGGGNHIIFFFLGSFIFSSSVFSYSDSTGTLVEQ